MKKILMALMAVSMVLPAAAMADDTTLYGQFRYSVSNVDTVSNNQVAQDNTSLLGVKGSYGDDIKAFFHLQTGANADVAGGTALAQRFFYGGLKSDSMGTLQYGRMTNAYKMVGFKMDPLYNTAHFGVDGQTFNGALATYGLSGENNGFTDNAVEYTSPKLADAITVNLGLYIDDTAANEHNNGVGLTYSANGITAGVQMLMTGKNGGFNTLGADSDATRLHASYKGEGYSVGVSYETIDAGNNTPTNLFLTGTYGLSEKTDLVATIGVVDADAASTVGTNEGTGYTLSVFNDITTNTKVFASYASADLDDANATDATALSFGVQHKFASN